MWIAIYIFGLLTLLREPVRDIITVTLGTALGLFSIITLHHFKLISDTSDWFGIAAATAMVIPFLTTTIAVRYFTQPTKPRPLPNL